jgi:hypothetical protein
MKPLVVLFALCGAARADGPTALASVHHEASAVHDVDDTRGGAPARDLALASLHFHVLGTTRVAFHAGVDLAAGGTLDRGAFAYEVALLLGGLAVRLDANSFVALGIGFGAMGAIGTISSGPSLPIELDAELGSDVRVISRVRVQYVDPASRANGSPSAPFGDELEAMLGVRLGRSQDDHGFRTGNGYYVGGAYRELLGARYLGIALGYSIDAGL